MNRWILAAAGLALAAGCGKAFAPGQAGTGGTSASSGSATATATSSSGGGSTSASVSSSTSSVASGSGGAGGGVRTTCELASSGLADEFTTVIDETKWTLYVATTEPTTQNGELVLELAVNGSYIGIASKQRFDFTDCAVWTQITLPGDSLEIDSTLALFRDDSSVSVGYFGDTFGMQAYVDGNVAQENFRASPHNLDRWWMIQEKDGRIYGRTSNNGSTWNAEWDFATPPWMTDVGVEIGTVKYQGSPPNTIVKYELIGHTL